MEEAILATKNMIEKQVNAGKPFMFGTPFSEYQKVYAATNENIFGYTCQFDFSNKEKALSVLGSGDHYLHAVYYGIQDVDTFDSNCLTEYFALGIKRAAILTYSYSEYLQFVKKIISSDTTLDELTEIIYSLIPNMDEKHQLYWKQIINYNYEIQKNHSQIINLFQMLLLNIAAFLHTTLTNVYLHSEKEYNTLKENLKRATISFQCCDVFQLPDSFRSKYDFIFLSNIADYFYHKYGYDWIYDCFYSDKEKFMNMLRTDGVLAIAYLGAYYSKVSHKAKTHPISCSNLAKKDLTTEEILTFSNVVNNKISNTIKDGLLLERKR